MVALRGLIVCLLTEIFFPFWGVKEVATPTQRVIRVSNGNVDLEGILLLNCERVLLGNLVEHDLDGSRWRQRERLEVRHAPVIDGVGLRSSSAHHEGITWHTMLSWRCSELSSVEISIVEVST